MISLLLSVIGLLAFASAGFWLWKRRMDAELTDAADYEYDLYQKQNPEFVAHLDKDGFRAVFFRTHFPRFPAYALACVATFLISLPLSFIMLLAGGWLLGKLNVVPEPDRIAGQLLQNPNTVRLEAQDPEAVAKFQALVYYVNELSGFYYFFGVLAIWLLVVFLFLRHYHKNRPGYLREEIIRAKSDL